MFHKMFHKIVSKLVTNFSGLEGELVVLGGLEVVQRPRPLLLLLRRRGRRAGLGAAAARK
jgi:hypothetical protein